MRRTASLFFAILCFLILSVPPLAAQGITGIIVHDDGRRPGRPHRIHRPPRLRPIAIDAHHVDVRIEGDVATTKIKQIFRNPNRMILEGTYLFPVARGASLTEFTMVMNGKTVRGEVLEKEKARKIYEGIVRSMRDPALLEYVGQDLFKARVFPIPAGGKVEITLSYVQTVTKTAGVAEFRYPLKTQAFSQTPVASLSLRATIKSGTDIKSVFSSSHKIDQVRKGDREVRLSFEGKQAQADRDFHLFWTLSDQQFGLSLLTEHSTRDGGFFMMTLAPKQEYAPSEIAPKDVVFVIDTSGSMQEHSKMEQARKALTHGLIGLNEKDRFNIVGFATEARPYADTPITATKPAIAEACAWVKELRASGGTNIHDALNQGLAGLGESDRVQIVVFITDGLPTIGETGTEAILKGVAKSNAKNARVFAFGVGYDVNTQLLDLLAERNRGTRDYVTPSQNLELVLSSFFDKIAYPVLSDLAVTVDGVEILESYPKVLPDLFKGTELVVYGRYKGDGMKAIRLKGKVGDRQQEYVYEGRFSKEHTGRDFIPVLWAKRKVGYLWDQIRLTGRNAELKSEIVRLGKKFGIATPYTSFLVTEDEAHANADRIRGRRRQAPGGGGGRFGRVADFFGQSLRDGRKSGEVFDTATATAESRRLGLRSLGDRAGALRADGGSPGAGGGARGGVPRPRSAPATATKPRDSHGKNAVDSSLKAKKMREGDLDNELDDALAEKKRLEKERKINTVRRLHGRTFHLRNGVWVDARLDALAAKERDTKMEKIEAWSTAYFELIRQIPGIAKYLAQMPELMIEIKGRLIWVVPAVPTKEEAKPAGKVPVENPKKS